MKRETECFSGDRHLGEVHLRGWGSVVACTMGKQHRKKKTDNKCVDDDAAHRGVTDMEADESEPLMDS